MWFFERHRNPTQFGGRPGHGLGSAFWWSAVTMTTVGYGNKSPQTLGGRLIALVWMFTSVIIISSFTAQIASALDAVASGRAAACVYDAPILRYTLRDHPELTIPGSSFERRDYAIALPLESPLRKRINIALLEYTPQLTWRHLQERYLDRE